MERRRGASFGSRRGIVVRILLLKKINNNNYRIIMIVSFKKIRIIWWEIV